MASTVGSQTVYEQIAIAGGDTIANTAAATAFASAWTMPANFLKVGRTLRVSARGVYSTLGALPGNITVDLVAGATVLASTGAQPLSVGLANAGWEVKGDVACVTTGAGGTVEAQGLTVMATAAVTANPIFMTNVATVALDTTAAKAVGIQVTFSIASAFNTITQRLLLVDIGGAQ